MYSNLDEKVFKNNSYIATTIKTLVNFRHLEPHTVFVCHATQESISLVLFPPPPSQVS